MLNKNKRLRQRREDCARQLGKHNRQDWLAIRTEFGRCVICGSKDRIEKGHIIPLRWEGLASNGIDNIQPILPTLQYAREI